MWAEQAFNWLPHRTASRSERHWSGFQLLPCPHVTHLHVCHKRNVSCFFLILPNVLTHITFINLFFPAWAKCVHVMCKWSYFCHFCLLSIHMFLFVDHPLCVSVPPHDVKRIAWNSTGNSSYPESELSQSSIPAAPLGSNTVAAKSNTKQSKNTSALTD